MNNPTPIRVMYVSHTAMLGGGEIALLNLVRTIDRAVICPIVVLASEGPLAEALRPYAQVHILELDESVRQAKKDGLGLSSVLRTADFWRLGSYLARLKRFIREQARPRPHRVRLSARTCGESVSRLSSDSTYLRRGQLCGYVKDPPSTRSARQSSAPEGRRSRRHASPTGNGRP